LCRLYVDWLVNKYLKLIIFAGTKVFLRLAIPLQFTLFCIDVVGI
jgi:hypothetical protein